MEPQTIKWHPYPQEKPTTSGFHYIVTVKGYGCIGFNIFTYDPQFDVWGIEGLKINSSIILAWAEIPKPYEG